MAKDRNNRPLINNARVIVHGKVVGTTGNGGPVAVCIGKGEHPGANISVPESALEILPSDIPTSEVKADAHIKPVNASSSPTNVNVEFLNRHITRLEQENMELRKERDDLRQKLAGKPVEADPAKEQADHKADLIKQVGGQAVPHETPDNAPLPGAGEQAP